MVSCSCLSAWQKLSAAGDVSQCSLSLRVWALVELLSAWNCIGATNPPACSDPFDYGGRVIWSSQGSRVSSKQANNTYLMQNIHCLAAKSNNIILLMLDASLWKVIHRGEAESDTPIHQCAGEWRTTWVQFVPACATGMPPGQLWYERWWISKRNHGFHYSLFQIYSPLEYITESATMPKKGRFWCMFQKSLAVIPALSWGLNERAAVVIKVPPALWIVWIPADSQLLSSHLKQWKSCAS